MKAFFLSLGLATLTSAVPSQYGVEPLLRRAVSDSCKAPEGTGTCQHTANCPGISYPTGLCPKDPDDVQCCVKLTCEVPSTGSGYCRSVKNNGCSGGSFHSGHCPGSDDIQCCVKKASSPEPTPKPPPTPPPASPCTAAALDNLLFTAPISDFVAAKQASNRPTCFNWHDDGCSCSPDELYGFDFLHPCWRHDFGYRNMKAQKRFDAAMKTRVDDNLKRDLYDVCAKFSGLLSIKGIECRRIADLYIHFVRKYGKKRKRDVDVDEGGTSAAKSLLVKRECDLADALFGD